jgi:hypothetical protein
VCQQSAEESFGENLVVVIILRFVEPSSPIYMEERKENAENKDV